MREDKFLFCQLLPLFRILTSFVSKVGFASLYLISLLFFLSYIVILYILYRELMFFFSLFFRKNAFVRCRKLNFLFLVLVNISIFNISIEQRLRKFFYSASFFLSNLAKKEQSIEISRNLLNPYEKIQKHAKQRVTIVS